MVVTPAHSRASPVSGQSRDRRIDAAGTTARPAGVETLGAVPA